MFLRQLIVFLSVMIVASIGYTPGATAKYRISIPLTDSVLEAVPTEPPVLLAKGGKRPKAQSKQAAKKSKPSSSKTRHKGKTKARAEPKTANIGVSNTRRNLKAVDKRATHVTRPFKHSLSTKERAQVREKLDRSRNEVITNRSALTHKFDRASANLKPFAGGRIRKYTTTKTETFYRVYSGNITSGGFLIKTPPKSREEAKRVLNLPSGNKANKIQKVTVPAGVRLERSRVTGENAAKPGGWAQYRILPRQENRGIVFHKGNDLK